MSKNRIENIFKEHLEVLELKMFEILIEQSYEGFSKKYYTFVNKETYI